MKKTAEHKELPTTKCPICLKTEVSNDICNNCGYPEYVMNDHEHK